MHSIQCVHHCTLWLFQRYNDSLHLFIFSSALFIIGIVYSLSSIHITGAIIARRGQLITGSTNKKSLRLWSVTGLSELLLPSNSQIGPVPTVQVEDEMSLDGYVTAMVFDETLDMVRQFIMKVFRLFSFCNLLKKENIESFKDFQ